MANVLEADYPKPGNEIEDLVIGRRSASDAQCRQGSLYWHSVFRKVAIYSFQKAAHLPDGPDRDQFDTVLVSRHAQLLAGSQTQCLADRQRNDHLIFRRNGNGIPIDRVIVIRSLYR